VSVKRSSLRLARRMVPARPAAAPWLVCQREEDGKWAIGWHDDAAGLFESRAFAAAVAEKEVLRAADSA